MLIYGSYSWSQAKTEGELWQLLRRNYADDGWIGGVFGGVWEQK